MILPFFRNLIPILIKLYVKYDFYLRRLWNHDKFVTPCIMFTNNAAANVTASKKMISLLIFRY